MIARHKLCDMLQTHMGNHGVQLHFQVGTLLEVRRDIRSLKICLSMYKQCTKFQ